MLVIQRPSVEPLEEAGANRQRFAIGPLEPGFGHTLGNSLRRTLLSSIPGAAVTQVRFDEALHEFTTLKGVTEDVTDIILNVKDLVITSKSDAMTAKKTPVCQVQAIQARSGMRTSKDPSPIRGGGWRGR